MKIPLPPGLTTFPAYTRVGEDSWERVAADGTVDCPEDNGDWIGTLRPKDSGYILDLYGRHEALAFPYVDEAEVEAAANALAVQAAALLDKRSAMLAWVEAHRPKAGRA